MSYVGGKCGYWQQYTLHAHAHLLGSDCVNHDELIPSAVLCVVFFLLAGGLGAKWYLFLLDHFLIMLALAGSMFLSGVGFAIRAGIANTAHFNVARNAVIAEQIFLVAGELVLVASSVLRTTALALTTLRDQIGSQITVAFQLIQEISLARGFWVYANYGVLAVSFILDCVGFSRGPIPTRPDSISLQATQLRIAGAIFPFLLTIANFVWLILGKLRSPQYPDFLLPIVGFGVVMFINVLMLIPALYAFLVAAVSADDSTLTCSTLWFYLGFALMQLLSVLPFLGLTLNNFGYHHVVLDVVHADEPLLHESPRDHGEPPHDSPHDEVAIFAE